MRILDWFPPSLFGRYDASIGHVQEVLHLFSGVEPVEEGHKRVGVEIVKSRFEEQIL